MLPMLAALRLGQAHIHPAEHGVLDQDPPKAKGSMVDLKVGAETSPGYVAKPKGKPRGALLVIHEYWGLNGWVKPQADELAGLGDVALAHELHSGKAATAANAAGAAIQAN